MSVRAFIQMPFLMQHSTMCVKTRGDGNAVIERNSSVWVFLFFKALTSDLNEKKHTRLIIYRSLINGNFFIRKLQIPSNGSVQETSVKLEKKKQHSWTITWH